MWTFYIRLGAVTVLLVLLSLVFTAASENTFDTLFARVLGTEQCEAEHLCVHFLDVGQGDATFIESPTGVQVLIDGGPGSGVLRELGGRVGFLDRSLDVVVATHPDGDHIGGLIDVFERFDIATVLLTGNTNDTSASDAFQTSVRAEDAEVVRARAGQVIGLGGGATLDVLFPDRDASEFESNTSSIILRLVYGESEFLFMADAPQAVEEHLVRMYGDDIESDVLKVGHHGSDTSTAETFVSAVDPEHAVISAGRDNRYGHPHEDVLETLASHDIEIKNTAEYGSITFVSDGESLLLR